MSRCRRSPGAWSIRPARCRAGDIAALTQTLKDFETRKGSQIAVLIVPTTQPETIEQYSIRVAEAWKIGRKKVDDGALLVVAKNDRKLRIEVGYGLEGALTDVTSRRIIDEIITPKFRTGDFAGGISAGVDRIIRRHRRRAAAGAGAAASHGDDSDLLEFIDPFNPFVIIGVLVLGGVLRSVLGRLFGSVATGGVVGGGLVHLRIAGRLRHRRRHRFVFTMFGDGIIARRRRARGGGRRLGGSSGSSSAAARVRQRVRATAAGSAAAAAVLAAAARRGAGRSGASDMGIKRIGKHLLEHRWRVRRIFPPQVLAAIEQAIKAGEATHSGQVRFVVEGALDGAPLFRDQSARERALDIFSHLRIWDTAHNNGVLIYLLLADRDVEIVADRGIDAKVGSAGWEKICAGMEAEFRAANFEGGVIKGIAAVSQQLAKYFPAQARRARTNCRMRRW